VDLITACAICGGDAATDKMLVNVAIAGGLSVPFFLRDQITARVRRWRGQSGEELPDSCPISAQDEDGATPA